MSVLELLLKTQYSAEFTLQIDLAIESGFTVLFGPSGAGKTTLLNSIAGLIKPEQGRIVLKSRVLFESANGINVPVEERRIGYVFQTLALFPHLTAEQNIRYGIVDESNDRQKERVEQILGSFRIAHLAKRLPQQISGGERQRVALARTLVTEPQLLLLDEPLSALERETKLAIIADLKRWNESRSIPVLYVTHSHGEVAALSGSVVVLKHGSIVSRGEARQLLNEDFD
jgi:molybdate transport system ATP-binding protein